MTTTTAHSLVKNPNQPDIDFYVTTPDFLEVERRLLKEIETYEVLGADLSVSTHYDRPRTDMDVPDSTTAVLAIGLTIVKEGRVDHRYGHLLTVRAVGQVGDVRYQELRDEARETLTQLRTSEFNTDVQELVNRFKARIVSAARLEDIRTEVVNTLVADTTATLRRKTAENVEKGSTVKVVRGRKVPLGTTGKVIWKGKTHAEWGWRVGIKPDPTKEEVMWTALNNVEVVYDEATVVAAALAEAKEKYTQSGLARIFGAPRA
jgi:hypothetical protein